MAVLEDIEVWPAAQNVVTAGDPLIMMTHFSDGEQYHATLRETVLRLERTSSHKEELPRGGCGIKVHHIENWSCKAAKLLTERAVALFKHAVKMPTAFIDAGWANVYRAQDYCMPHSHIRAQASVVYLVDPGDEDPKDRLMGKFYFADSRLAYCCQHQPGRMTRLLIPDMKPGTMIIFPGQVVHAVNPYFGARPRITCSWNINAEAMAGDPRKMFEGKK